MLGSIGKKHVEIAMKWIPSAAAYGGTATLALLYFTEWKAVLQYMPYYGSKYSQEK